MMPMPIPERGGSIEVLRSFLNVRSDVDFVLVVAWALACLRERGPYPVLVLSGEQGSAKSTFASIMRALIDPNTAPLRALPREDRDLFIAASNGHVLAFDNVSGLKDWISDTLCRLATGGGFAVRQLYTDGDEILFDAQRPAILNGIEDSVTRPDLADRAVFLTLEPIPEDQRRPEQELWAAFEAERPRILGVLLDAVVGGLKRLPETRLEKLPRMADFALWATACETALWPAGTFWSAYGGNLAQAVEEILDANPVAATIRDLIILRGEWRGTRSELLAVLSELAGDRLAKSKDWPATETALSGRLRRAAPNLRKIGIEIGRERKALVRTITITALPERVGNLASSSSSASSPVTKSNPVNDLAADDRMTQNGANDDDDANGDASSGADDASDDANGDAAISCVIRNPLKNKVGDDDDADDAKIPPFSGKAINGRPVHYATGRAIVTIREVGPDGDHACQQCGDADGTERYLIGGKQVWLHPICRAHRRRIAEGDGLAMLGP